MGSQALNIVVRLEAGSEPIAGELAAQQTTSTRFEGWTELAALIEELRRAARHETRAYPRQPGSPARERGVDG